MTEPSREVIDKDWVLSAIERGPTPEELDKLDVVKKHVLDSLEVRRQEELDDLFHVDSDFAKNNPDQAERLRQRFLADKRALKRSIEGRQPNIGEMFDLSLEYLGLVHLFKLAETTHDVADESARLREEYGDLLHWFNKQGVEMRRISKREPDGCWYSVGYVGQPDDGPYGYRAVINRTRVLSAGVVQIREESGALGEEAELVLMKETVFTLPATYFREIMMNGPNETAGPGGFAWSDRQKELLDTQIYGDVGRGILQRINTAYFSAMTPVAEVAKTKKEY
jgi:hypothetical protein